MLTWHVNVCVLPLIFCVSIQRRLPVAPDLVPLLVAVPRLPNSFTVILLPSHFYPLSSSIVFFHIFQPSATCTIPLSKLALPSFSSFFSQVSHSFTHTHTHRLTHSNKITHKPILKKEKTLLLC